MMKPRYMAGWFGLSLLIIVADQLSKIWVSRGVAYGDIVPVIPGFFNITLMVNSGAAFSFLADAGGWQKYLFTLLAFTVTGWLSWQVIHGRFSRRMNCAAVFIVGGALGNVIDRLKHGYVIDFIQVYYKSWYYPAFNLADSFICVGAVLMALDSFSKNHEKRTETE